MPFAEKYTSYQTIKISKIYMLSSILDFVEKLCEPQIQISFPQFSNAREQLFTKNILAYLVSQVGFNI